MNGGGEDANGSGGLLSRVRRHARRVVGPALRRDRREFILGDLEELHELWSARYGRRAADRRYLKALFGSVGGGWRRGTEPGRLRHERRQGIAAGVLSDVREAIRTLRRQPVLTVIVAVTLGLGIGAAGAVFGLVNELLLRPLPGVRNPGGAAFVEFSEADRRNTGISGPLAEAIRASATLLDGIATFDYVGVHASAEGVRPREVRAYTVFGDYFELLGVRPVAGRLLSAGETGPQSDPYVAVISEQLRESLFAPSDDVIGQRLDVNGSTFTIIGVTAGGFGGTDRGWTVDLWVPRSAYVPLTNSLRERLWARDSRLNQDFVARPLPGVSFAAAEAELNALLRRLGEAEPLHGEYVSELHATLHPGLNVSPGLRPYLRPALGILALAGILVLLIPCANVANLLLMRALKARGELAVRRALGASTARIARRALIESFLLAGSGALTGLGVAWLIGRTVQGESLWGLPGFDGFSVDWRVLAFACIAVLVTALLSGLLPAVLAARFDPGGALRDAGTHVTGRQSELRNGMSILQIALSLTLLVGGILLARTVRNMYALDPGITLDGVYSASIDMGRLQPPESGALEVLYRNLLDRVQAVRGVRGVALQSFYGPYRGALRSNIATSPETAAQPVWVATHWITPGWFELLDIEPVAGRSFRPADAARSGRLPVILTRSLAYRLFGQTAVVGRTVHVGMQTLEEAAVVGVIGDVRLTRLHATPDEALFLPFPAAQTNPVTVVIRVADSDPAAPARIREALEAAAPAFPVPEPEALRSRIDDQLAEQRILARLLVVFSGLAVLLAAGGLYGVVAFGATGRSREFAIRIAVGADGTGIATLVFRSAALIVAAGTAVGLAGAYGLSTLIGSRLFGVSPMDPLSYVGAAALLAAVATLACWLPARAAARLDPVTTLKQE